MQFMKYNNFWNTENLRQHFCTLRNPAIALVWSQMQKHFSPRCASSYKTQSSIIKNPIKAQLIGSLCKQPAFVKSAMCFAIFFL